MLIHYGQDRAAGGGHHDPDDEGSHHDAAVGTATLKRAAESVTASIRSGGACSFVAIGAVSLMPAMPEGAWLVAAGLVMLGASAVRAGMRLRVHGATVVVGVVALSAGIFTVAGLTTEVGPLVLIVLGLTLGRRCAGSGTADRRRAARVHPLGGRHVHPDAGPDRDRARRDRDPHLRALASPASSADSRPARSRWSSSALGFVASASAVVPGFAALLAGSRLYLALASLAGLVALVCGAITITQATEQTLAILVVATIGLWAAASVRHSMRHQWNRKATG